MPIFAIPAEMSSPADWGETARRLRAAIAYAGSSKEFGRAGAARAMGVTEGKVDRMIGTKPGNRLLPTWDERWALADAVGLPREWFSADLGRLAEIVPDDAPRFATPVGAGAPSIPGETGRRIQAQSPKRPGRRRPDSDQGSETAEGGSG